MAIQRLLQPRALLAIAVLGVGLGLAMLLWRNLTSSSANDDDPLAYDEQVMAIDARVVCSLSNEDALASLVTGADGGSSVPVAGKTWWLFGDTIFRGDSGKQIEPNSIASSRELSATGCPKLEYLSQDGIAVPFIEKDGSLTVWPTGAWPADDGKSFYFYTAYVYGSGPYSYTVDDIGIGSFDTQTRETTILTRRLWDETSGFASRVLHVQPVEVSEDGYLLLFLHTESGAKLLSRAAITDLANPSAYGFWDGATWSDQPSKAASLWAPEPQASEVEQLTRFENGASVAWNEALQRYVALVNVGFDRVGARTAEHLEGPWSEPAPWLDCLAFARPRVPACYSPQQHPVYARDGGRTLYATISAIEPYETQFVEITLGSPVHEYSLDGAIRYSLTPLAGWEDEGVAFYASERERPGFVTLYAWERGDAVRYAADSPGDGFQRKEPAFSAPISANSPGGLIHYRPVYEWTDGERQVLSPLASGLEEFGYTRGSAMFYAP